MCRPFFLLAAACPSSFFPGTSSSPLRQKGGMSNLFPAFLFHKCNLSTHRSWSISSSNTLCLFVYGYVSLYIVGTEIYLCCIVVVHIVFVFSLTLPTIFPLCLVPISRQHFTLLYFPLPHRFFLLITHSTLSSSTQTHTHNRTIPP